MGLDRVIVLRFKRYERNHFNELVEIEPIDTRVWCEKRNSGSSDQATVAGVEIVNVVTYTTRYFQALIDEPIATLFVIDENGREFNASSVAESDARRRFIDLQVAGLGA